MYGFTEQTQTVNLAPGAVQPVIFTVVKSQPDDYSVNSKGQSTGLVVAGPAEQAKVSHQGMVMALATTVLVILSGLLMAVVRRRFQNG